MTPLTSASTDPGAPLLAHWRALTDARRDAPDAALTNELRARYPTEREFDAMLTRRAQRRTLPRRAGITLDEFRACLEAYLRDNVTTDFSVQDLRWMSGGGSKIQLTFQLQWADPNRGRCSERLVARLEPQESLSATSRLREAQLIEAFQGVLPVPQVRWVDDAGRWFPEPTLIYTFAEGVSKPSGGGGRVSGVGSQFNDRLREQLGSQFIEHLARIHTLDATQRNFSAFDIPRVGSTETALWQLNRASRIWDEDRTEEMPLMAVAAAWLRRHLPVLDRASVLHGDYRAGNFLFDEGSGRITAWLDWERGYIGDRHRDLAWITLPLFGRYADDGRTLLVSGLVPLEAFYRRYEEASGLHVDRDRLRYYRMLNNYQLIASTLGTAQRVARLGRSHQDVLLSWIEGAVYPLAADLRQHLKEST